MTIFQVLTNQVEPKDVIKEMAKRYENSYLLYQDKYIRYVGYSTETKTFVFDSIDEGSLTFSASSEVEIKIPNPKRGFYNTPDGVVFVFRNPYRQWRRGLNSDTLITLTLTSLLTPKEMYSNFFSKKTVSCLNNIPNTNLQEAIKTCSLVGSAALTLDFAVCYHLTKPTGYMLWYNSFIIGEIQDKKLTIQHPYFLQEVKDSNHLWENFEVCYDTN